MILFNPLKNNTAQDKFLKISELNCHCAIANNIT